MFYVASCLTFGLSSLIWNACIFPCLSYCFFGSSSLLWNACFLLFRSSLGICNARFFLWFSYVFLGFFSLTSNACDQLALLFCCCLFSGLLISLKLIIQMDILAKSLMCSVGSFFFIFCLGSKFPHMGSRNQSFQRGLVSLNARCLRSNPNPSLNSC